MKTITAQKIAEEIKANVDSFWNDRISYEDFAAKNESLWRDAQRAKKSSAVLRNLPVARLVTALS